MASREGAPNGVEDSQQEINPDKKYITTLGLTESSRSTQEFQANDSSRFRAIGGFINDKRKSFQERFKTWREDKLIILDLKDDAPEERTTPENQLTDNETQRPEASNVNSEMPVAEASRTERPEENASQSQIAEQIATAEALAQEVDDQASQLEVESGELSKSSETLEQIRKTLELVKVLLESLKGSKELQKSEKPTEKNGDSREISAEIDSKAVGAILRENPPFDDSGNDRFIARFENGEASQVDFAFAQGVIEKRLSDEKGPNAIEANYLNHMLEFVKNKTVEQSAVTPEQRSAEILNLYMDMNGADPSIEAARVRLSGGGELTAADKMMVRSAAFTIGERGKDMGVQTESLNILVVNNRDNALMPSAGNEQSRQAQTATPRVTAIRSDRSRWEKKA